MIKNSKNIKKIQLLYKDIDSNNTIEQESKEKVTKDKNLIEDKNTPKDIYSTNIRNDLLKTLIFLIFAFIVLFIAFIFTSESNFASQVREEINIQPIFLR